VSTFEVLPAIDLRGGRPVRLRQGDFAQETVYEGEARSVARGFADAGARWVHVVDLDGALAGEPRQLHLVAEMAVESFGRLHVELGGGLRTADAVAGALAAGVARVAVGTAVIRDPDFAAGLVARHGTDRIAASIDVRDGFALGEGWRVGAAALPVAEAVERLADAGITIFEVTAIERDGLLEGPDLGLLRSLVALDRGMIIASGGVTTIEDVLAIQAAGCAGVIIGRALYEGRLDFAGVLAALEAPQRG
jgi:phosphoribosylformimino-5-aminoimidazole carboxamide ribotide isomerase